MVPYRLAMVSIFEIAIIVCHCRLNSNAHLLFFTLTLFGIYSLSFYFALPVALVSVAHTHFVPMRFSNNRNISFVSVFQRSNDIYLFGRFSLSILILIQPVRFFMLVLKQFERQAHRYCRFVVCTVHTHSLTLFLYFELYRFRIHAAKRFESPTTNTMLYVYMPYMPINIYNII